MPLSRLLFERKWRLWDIEDYTLATAALEGKLSKYGRRDPCRAYSALLTKKFSPHYPLARESLEHLAEITAILNSPTNPEEEFSMTEGMAYGLVLMDEAYGRNVINGRQVLHHLCGEPEEYEDAGIQPEIGNEKVAYRYKEVSVDKLLEACSAGRAFLRASDPQLAALGLAQRLNLETNDRFQHGLGLILWLAHGVDHSAEAHTSCAPFTKMINDERQTA